MSHLVEEGLFLFVTGQLRIDVDIVIAVSVHNSHSTNGERQGDGSYVYFAQIAAAAPFGQNYC